MLQCVKLGNQIKKKGTSERLDPLHWTATVELATLTNEPDTDARLDLIFSTWPFTKLNNLLSRIPSLILFLHDDAITFTRLQIQNLSIPY